MKSPLTHIVIASLVCVLTIAWYGFWYDTVRDKSTVVALLENKIVTKTETAARIASAHASLVEIAGDEASMRSYFVPETGVVAFIDNLETQGKKIGTVVSVLSVSTSDAETQPTLTFALTINGKFDAVMRTLGAIEYAPYDLSVSTLSIQQDGKNGWSANVSLRVGSVSATAATSTL